MVLLKKFHIEDVTEGIWSGVDLNEQFIFMCH